VPQQLPLAQLRSWARAPGDVVDLPRIRGNSASQVLILETRMDDRIRPYRLSVFFGGREEWSCCFDHKIAVYALHTPPRGWRAFDAARWMRGAANGIYNLEEKSRCRFAADGGGDNNWLNS
jgi:hypothetical protein